MEGFEGHFSYIEMSVYRKMLKSGLSDPIYHQIGWKLARMDRTAGAHLPEIPKHPQFNFKFSKKSIFLKNPKFPGY